MREEIFLEGISIIEIVLGKNYSEKQLQLFQALLGDIPEESFISGINIMLRQREYSTLPLPADIRKYCLETREEDLEVRVAQARIKLKKGIDCVGTYNSVVFDDPIIHLVVRDFGGWIKVGGLPYDEYEKLLKWDFPKLYRAYAGRKNREIPVVLKGRSEGNEVKYIGDRKKAEKWVSAYIQYTQSQDCYSLEGVALKHLRGAEPLDPKLIG